MYLQEWRSSPPLWTSPSDYYVDFKPERNGSYKFEIKFPNPKMNYVGYLISKPKSESGSFHLDSLSIQTLMPKLMGPIDNWDDITMFTSECNYNMIHFTPFQSLGYSDSAYCIKDQLEVDPRYKATNLDIENFLKELKNGKGIRSMTDLVLNHTACDSQWLTDHPEATYNLSNCPHLIPAFLLDQKLVDINADIVNGKNTEFEVIQNEEQLSKFSIFLTNQLTKLKLEQYRQCNVEEQLSLFKKAHKPASGIDLELKNEICSSRLCRNSNYDSYSGTEEQFVKTINWLNQIESDNMVQIIKLAVDNIIGTVRYERLDHNGPKYGKFTCKRPICTKYFQAPLFDSWDESLLEEEDTKQNIFAHNGWVMDWDPSNCFVDQKYDIYLKRQLVPWDDSVKLNYGRKHEDSPALWQRMTEYSKWTGANFDAVRIDNCHSTPLHVAEYFLQVARTQNPYLLVLAELFTNSKAQDDLYVSRLGLDLLVRESLQVHSPSHFMELFNSFGRQNDHLPYSTETRSSLAAALMMDVTHDNVSCIEKRSLHDCLPTAAILSFCQTPIGSSRGFDELIPHHINVVTETRPYQAFDSLVNDSNFYKCKAYLNSFHSNQACEPGLISAEMAGNVAKIRKKSLVEGVEYILFAYTAFDKNEKESAMIEISTKTNIDTIHFYASCENQKNEYSANEKFINGLRHTYSITESMKISDIDTNKIRCKVHSTADGNLIRLILSRGDVIILSGKLPAINLSLNSITRNINDLQTIIKKIDLTEMNQILFSCEKEENSNSPGNGTYIGIIIWKMGKF